MPQINLPANLPENWAPGQIVAPTGQEAGLSTQHGYNYLMQQVNAAQKALNNLDSSQMLYGKSDLQTIEDALDNVIAGVSSLNEKTVAIEDILPNKATLFDVMSTYSDGNFDIENLSITLPNRFILRFSAPASYSQGDKIRIGDAEITVVTVASPDKPAPDSIFATNALVSFDVDLMAGKAFFASWSDSTGDISTGDIAYRPVQIGSGITGTIAGGYWTVCGKTIGFNIRIVISSGKISVNPNSPTHILKGLPAPQTLFGFSWSGSLGDGTVKMGGCNMAADGSISAYAQAGQGDVYVLNASGLYLSK